MRDTYENGLLQLKNNTFESKEAGAEWQDWVSGLSQEELAMVTSNNWE